MTITVTAVGQTNGEVLFVDTEEGVWKDPRTAIPVATNTDAGLMAAAEHVKLAAVEAGATLAGTTGDAFASSHPGGNQHIDWTVDQGATNIHASNIVIPVVKLDDAAAPDDNTDLNASTSAHGLLLKATAPAAGLVNVVGIANGETAYTNKALFDSTNPAALGVASPGTATVAARRDHVHPSTVAIADIDLDGGTDIGAALADADLILVDDGAGGTNRKAAMSRVKTYAQGIALDTFATPTDVTTLNASTSAHGLLPKLSNVATEYLSGTGAWGTPAGGGETLSADRTYYVRTDGSDSNNGLADTAGGAFLTIQKAVNVARTVDPSTYTVTIQIRDGTYNENVTVFYPMIRLSQLVIQGNSGTPSNVVVQSISLKNTGVNVAIKYLKLASGSAVGLITATYRAHAEITGVNFGAATTAQIWVSDHATLLVSGSYTISAGAAFHFVSSSAGAIGAISITITVSGTPAFSTAFAYADVLALISMYLVTVSGSATGKRYSATMNSVIQTYGGGSNFFPGNSAGTTATGGQYG